MSFDMQETGRYIRQYRKVAGLTQEELAQKVGISTMSIRRYESGERIASKDLIQSIAAALDVSPFYLLGDESALSPSEIKASMGLEGYLKSLGYEFIEDYEYNGKECLLCIDRNQKKLYLFSENQTSMLERSIGDFTKYTIAEFLKGGEEIADKDGWFKPQKPTQPAPAPSEGTDATPPQIGHKKSAPGRIPESG